MICHEVVDGRLGSMSRDGRLWSRARRHREVWTTGRSQRATSVLRWIAAFAALGGIVWAVPYLPFLHHAHNNATTDQTGQWVTKTIPLTPSPQPTRSAPNSPTPSPASAKAKAANTYAAHSQATAPAKVAIAVKLVQRPPVAKPQAVAASGQRTGAQEPAAPGSHAEQPSKAAPPIRTVSNVAAHVSAQALTSAAGEPTTTHAALQWQSYHVHHGETLSGLFHRAGLPAQAWIHILKLGHAVQPLRRLSPHHLLKLGTGPQGRLLALDYQINSTHTLKISRPSGSADWQTTVHAAPVTVLVDRVSAVVHHSLLSAAHRAGLTFRQAAQFADVFHWRVNLRRDIQPGARIVAVYNEREVHGHALAPGRIVAAKLVTDKHTWQAFWFDPKGSVGGYYNAQGHSLKAGILRAPIHYQYISSRFSLHRFDPYLHKWMPHYGVDYAADIGTPIEAAANGRVTYRARMRGYGRLIIISSFGRWQTYYAHMHRFAPGIHVGSEVHQGQIIGYVGESGWATGPHLHFGIRDGKHWVNPLKAKLPTAHAIPARYREKFEHRVHELLADIKAPKGKLGIAQHTTRSHAVSDSG